MILVRSNLRNQIHNYYAIETGIPSLQIWRFVGQLIGKPQGCCLLKFSLPGIFFHAVTSVDAADVYLNIRMRVRVGTWPPYSPPGEVGLGWCRKLNLSSFILTVSRRLSQLWGKSLTHLFSMF